MYITRDYCKSSPWTAICDMINDACFTQINPGTARLVSMVALGTTKTQIIIDVNVSTSADNSIPPVLITTYTYDRLDLASFFKQTRAYNISGMTLPVTTMDILRLIGAENDIVFDLEDVIHEKIENYTSGADIIIRANPRSLRFVGQLRVRLLNTLQRDISAMGTVLEFPEANIAYQAGVINGEVYTNDFDFTVERDFLRVLPSGYSKQCRQMAAVLSRITKHFWDAQNATVDYNVTAGVVDGETVCLVRYNGAPVPEWSPSTEYNYVLVLDLNPAYCPNIAGHLRLHYN